MFQGKEAKKLYRLIKKSIKPFDDFRLETWPLDEPQIDLTALVSFFASLAPERKASFAIEGLKFLYKDISKVAPSMLTELFLNYGASVTESHPYVQKNVCSFRPDVERLFLEKGLDPEFRSNKQDFAEYYIGRMSAFLQNMIDRPVASKTKYWEECEKLLASLLDRGYLPNPSPSNPFFSPMPGLIWLYRNFYLTEVDKDKIETGIAQVIENFIAKGADASLCYDGEKDLLSIAVGESTRSIPILKALLDGGAQVKPQHFKACKEILVCFTRYDIEHQNKLEEREPFFTEAYFLLRKYARLQSAKSGGDGFTYEFDKNSKIFCEVGTLVRDNKLNLPLYKSLCEAKNRGLDVIIFSRTNDIQALDGKIPDGFKEFKVMSENALPDFKKIPESSVIIDYGFKVDDDDVLEGWDLRPAIIERGNTETILNIIVKEAIASRMKDSVDRYR